MPEHIASTNYTFCFGCPVYVEMYRTHMLLKDRWRSPFLLCSCRSVFSPELWVAGARGNVVSTPTTDRTSKGDISIEDGLCREDFCEI